ncbi:MAG: sigma 54-interacting transcriptional regulator [Thermodesulfobacteriota bacterium]
MSTAMPEMLLKYDQIGEIFDCLSLGVILLSPERRVVSINRSAQLLTGYSAEDAVGQYCYHCFLDYLCGGRCKFLESDRDDRQTLVSDIEVKDQQNQSTSITKIESPIYGPDHEMLGCMEVFQDHSAFRELIKRVRFDDLRLKLILDNLDLGILTLDRGNHITFFNTKAEQITGFSRTDLLGKSCKLFFGPGFCRDFLDHCGYPNGNDDSMSAETQLITEPGHPLPVRVNYLPLKNEADMIVGGLITLTDLSLKYQFNSAIKDRYTFCDMVGKHPDMQKIFGIIPMVAASDATTLIEGATGTGKDLLAKIIHNASGRAEQKMVKVNCASLPDTLLESEMFGYARGAFTGADRDKPGRFQEADGGTIFLDEIGDLPLSLQAKLLRVIEDREFYPLGSRQTTSVDVRIISATNQDLKKLVDEGRFRQDLYYRLNVMRIALPPLKHRKSDLPLLIQHVLQRLCAARDIPVKKISEPAMHLLLNHDYPGNVRELENILEHALIICRDSTITCDHFPKPLAETGQTPHADYVADTDGNENNGHSERQQIIETLEQCRWNKSRTARALDIDRSTLWRKMKKYHIHS